MLTFVTQDRTLENDSVVIRHEFGHTIAAFALGFEVGRIAFARRPDLLLVGAVRSRLPDTLRSTYDQDQLNVTRLLAGEIAARKYLNISQDELCASFPLSGRSSFAYAESVTKGGQDDISKAISIACTKGDNWFAFLSDCHEHAKDIVENGWAGVERISLIVEKKGLPQKMERLVLVPGLVAIRAFERARCTPGGGLAVEAVHRELLGSIYLRLVRVFRKCVAKNLRVKVDPSETVGLPRSVLTT